MVFYYETLNKETIKVLATNIGRAAHIIRNYTQGAVTLEHPEILTLDNIAGQIEGQCRTIKSNLFISGEIKPLVKNVFKATNFLKKIMACDFFNDGCMNEPILADIRGYIDLIVLYIKKIDREINIAILTQSSNIFEDNVPPIPEIPTDSSSDSKLKACFDVDSVLSQVATDKFDTIEDFKANGIKLWSLMSNKAHSTQEIVSDYLNKQPYNDYANKIVNQAGNIENTARATISELTGFKEKLNGKALQKHNDNSIDNVNNLQGLIDGDSFTLKEKKEDIRRVLVYQRQLLGIWSGLFAANEMYISK